MDKCQTWTTVLPIAGTQCIIYSNVCYGEGNYSFSEIRLKHLNITAISAAVFLFTFRLRVSNLFYTYFETYDTQTLALLSADRQLEVRMLERTRSELIREDPTVDSRNESCKKVEENKWFRATQTMQRCLVNQPSLHVQDIKETRLLSCVQEIFYQKTNRDETSGTRRQHLHLGFSC